MKGQRGRNRILWIEHIGFSVIVMLSWLTELARLPHLIYGESFEPNWNRALLRTVVVVAIWAWVHLETRRLLRRLHHLEEFLLVCSGCRKIGDSGQWLSMEQYFGSNFATRTSHALCPECEKKFLARIDAVHGAAKPPPRGS